jgi:hypothetical protein
MTLKKYFIFYVLAVFVLFSACDNGNKPSEQKKNGGHALSKEMISASSLDDKTNYAAMDPVPLPKDFPEDVYLYANAKPIKSFKSAKGFSVTLFTSDTVEKVVADYREHAKLSGWQDEKVLSLSTQAILKYRVGEHPMAVQVAQKRGGSLITVSTQ